MQVKVYNQKGEETGKAQLPGEVFGLKVNPDLVHQVVVAQASNRRQNTAQTKDRSEVRGGGRKPWRQKGTGRARHGSRRSPIWVGGGITFGPRNERNYKKVVPKVMRKKALLMVLSAKAQNNFLILVDDLQIQEPKTKLVAGILNNLPGKNFTRLVVLSKYDKGFVLASRNIPKIAVIEARELNALDLLSYKYTIMTKEGVKEIEKTNEKFKMKNEKPQIKIKKVL